MGIDSQTLRTTLSDRNWSLIPRVGTGWSVWGREYGTKVSDGSLPGIVKTHNRLRRRRIDRRVRRQNHPVEGSSDQDIGGRDTSEEQNEEGRL